MNLHEYQGKQLFAEYGLPVSQGIAAETVAEAVAAADIIGGDKWDIVLEQHSLSYPGREVESLRCKCAQLHASRVKTPTGDPRYPEEVKLAKCIQYIISSSADFGDGTEEMDLASGTFTSRAPTEEVEDEDDSSSEGAEVVEEEELEDEVQGSLEAHR